MDRSTFRRNPSLLQRAGWTLAIVLLIIVPALDLAWNEPALDENQGARCQLHANPGVTLQPHSPVVALAAGLIGPSQACDHFPLIGPSIFIPPRA
jgi:hypothetical protein